MRILKSNFSKHFKIQNICLPESRKAIRSVARNKPKVLNAYCAEVNGVMVKGWNCPSTPERRSGWYCKLKNKKNEDLIFNGCSSASGEFADLFFKACVKHDFCYHSEPGFSGKTKEQCDLELLANTTQICNSQTSNTILCHTNAKAYYSAVKLRGAKAWACSKTSAGYEY